MADVQQVVTISKALQQVLDTYGSNAKVFSFIRSGLLDWVALELDPQTQDNLAGKVLNRRTGALAQSAKWRVRKSGMGFKLICESGTAYGAIHEHGGTIKPVNGRYLTIPLSAAKTPAGVTRKPAREWDDTFFYETDAGKLLLIQSRGTRIIPLFLLVKEVVVKASRWASKAVDETEATIPQYLMNRFP